MFGDDDIMLIENKNPTLGQQLRIVCRWLQSSRVVKDIKQAIKMLRMPGTMAIQVSNTQSPLSLVQAMAKQTAIYLHACIGEVLSGYPWDATGTSHPSDGGMMAGGAGISRAQDADRALCCVVQVLTVDMQCTARTTDCDPIRGGSVRRLRAASQVADLIGSEARARELVSDRVVLDALRDVGVFEHFRTLASSREAR